MSDSLKMDSWRCRVGDIWGTFVQTLRIVFMSKENFRLIAIGIIALLMSLVPPFPAKATVGWEVGDMVLDFGLGLESGEQVVLVDKYEVGHPFFVELTWKLNSEHCVYRFRKLLVKVTPF